MARNKVQFQKGMSEAQFEAAYGTGAGELALAGGFRMPRLRGPGALHRQTRRPDFVPMQRLPQTDIR